MNNPRCAVTVLAILLAVTRIASAEPAATPEPKVTAFILGTPGSGTDKTELFYTFVKDNFTTKITFTPDKEFKRSDGIHGSWIFEGGKLVLTVLDSEGFTIVFDPATLKDNILTGQITKGKRRGKAILKRTPK